jgi:hypothetical protein
VAFRPVTLIIALTFTLVGLATPVPAAPVAVPAQPGVKIQDIQDLIDEHLLLYPGAVQTGLFQITYSNPTFVMDWLPIDLGINGLPDCPSGWFCFYTYTNYGYPRGKLSSCGWQDLAQWGWQNRVESAHYHMSSGSVSFINHASGESTHNFDVYAFGVGTSQTTLADSYPYRNTADHVQRYC